MQLKKLAFMAAKGWNDLKALYAETPLNMEVHNATLSYYYIRFAENPRRLNKLITAFDEAGIPLNTTYVDVEEKRLHYYPISIGQYGLAVFHSWLDTGAEAKKAHFLRIADWFYQNRTESDAHGAWWLTDVPKPEYGVFAPWKSAFAQSRALSILLRAWQLTGQEEYLHVAKRALIPFTLDISAGGVSVDRAQGRTFYEEYVAAAPTRVLDGHGFSLFGLYDFVRAVRPETDFAAHAQAKQLFEEGIAGLKQQLPEFDLGFWMRFNRCDLPGYPQDDPCTIGYMKLVAAQLRIFHAITGDDFFQRYAAKLEAYLRPANVLRMYRFKAKALKQLNRL